MLLRMIGSLAIVAFGYYVGKQVGRNEHVREELAGKNDGAAQQTVEKQQRNESLKED